MIYVYVPRATSTPTYVHLPTHSKSTSSTLSPSLTSSSGTVRCTPDLYSLFLRLPTNDQGGRWQLIYNIMPGNLWGYNSRHAVRPSIYTLYLPIYCAAVSPCFVAHVLPSQW
ncbi:hypothetical protein GE21DRAFT_1088421 [Neurospora crassa]|nr:hypothetical protein GE21DRAFT_1088421 [Neurospora crassa]